MPLFPLPCNAALSSGQVGSGFIASGAVQGFFGSTRNIASGTVGVFDFGSGAVIAGTVGSGAIISGNIGSGQVGQFHIASGAITSGLIGVTGAAPDGTRFLRDDFTWAVATAAVNSGDIGSGKIASGAVQGFFGSTRDIASGTVGVFDFGSGAVIAGTVGSGAVVSGNIASGQIGNNHLGSGAVLSGAIASGQVGQFAISSGAVTSGRLGVTGAAPDGTRFLRDDFTWVVPTTTIISGAIGSGAIASGAVQGFFGTVRNIASGTVGVFDLGSGAVVAGTVGSGAIVSGNIASGQIGPNHLGSGAVLSGAVASGQIGEFHLASGAVRSGAIASGQVGQFAVASGSITSGRLGVTGAPDGTKFLRDDFTWSNPSSSGDVASGDIASGAVQGFFGTTRNIASGTVGVFDLGSGAVVANTVGSGAIVSGNIASGQIGPNHLGSGAVRSGAIASGQVSQFALSSGAVNSGQTASGAVITYARDVISDFFTCTEAISGVRCVTFDPVGSGQIRLAMAAVSGRMPAIGVVFENQLSGDICKVVSLGHVIPPTTAMGSGVCISGRIGKSLWVGASGQLVVLSGGGPTIGVGPTNSGAYGQRMGVSAMSGTVLVQLNPNMQFSGSANVTTNLQQWPV